MPGQPRVLVVGGGIAGLSFGAAALRRGLEVEIVERLTEVTGGAAGIGLHVPAQHMIDRLGIYERVRAVAVDLDGYRYFDPSGRQIASSPYTAVWGSPTWSVHRADLNAALRSAAPSSGLRVGLGVESLQQDHERVVARFSDGSVASYDLVVGADGVHSRARAAVYGEEPARYGGACFWRTTLSQQIVEGATGFVMAAGSLGLIPIAGDRTHAFFQVRSDRPFADPPGGRSARLRERFGHGTPKVAEALRLLGADEDIHFGPLEWIEPPAWGRDRIVLIGDASHAMAPPLALGGCMALEDGVVLAAVLAGALAAGDGLNDALAAFKARRDPRVQFVQQRTQITWDRNRGIAMPDEPSDPVEFGRCNFLPLLAEP